MIGGNRARDHQLHPAKLLVDRLAWRRRVADHSLNGSILRTGLSQNDNLTSIGGHPVTVVPSGQDFESQAKQSSNAIANTIGRFEGLGLNRSISD
jgi:hypothetical protein